MKTSLDEMFRIRVLSVFLLQSGKRGNGRSRIATARRAFRLPLSAPPLLLCLASLSGPAHGTLTDLNAAIESDVNGTYSADGSTSTDPSKNRSTQGLLLGAYQLTSIADFNQPLSGGAVTLGVSGGQYTVSIGTDDTTVSQISTLSAWGPGTPWASGLLAASRGSDGQYWGLEGYGYESGGGNAGAVSLTVSPADASNPVRIVLDTTTLPAETGSLLLDGVLALSQGGVNSSRWTSEFKQKHYYSQPGTAGAVTVDFSGHIEAVGGYASSTGTLVAAEVGIAAISRGGALQTFQQNPLGNYESGFNFEKPGEGGDVTVTLRENSEIILQQGSATGIYALSANGGLPAYVGVGFDSEYAYNVPTFDLVAGVVTVDIENGAVIRVGKSDAMASAGVLAISAGSEFGIAPGVSGNGLINLGGEGVGADVEVTSAGAIDAQGTLALGIGALSLSVGGEVAVGVLGVTESEYHASKKSPDHPGTLGNVTVTNTGSITTSGDSSHGIVAGSLGSGGVIYTALSGDEAARQKIAEGCQIDTVTPPTGSSSADAQANADSVRTYASKGQFPLCDGVQTGLALGNAAQGTSAVNGGTVTVTNSGTITTGVQGTQDGSEHAMGIFAQSLGGGGGNGSGGFLFWAGDAGGGGGNGGNVTVSNTGDIATYGSFSTGVLAQSIGGGGGVGGSTNFLPWVAVGARGGKGGYGRAVELTLDGAGTITTEGDFAQGVLAQSVGGGGGTGGAANGYGVAVTVSVGGVGGTGGDGGAVTVSGTDNNDSAWNAATGTIDTSAFDIVTLGEHGTGILAQSIGGGGGVGGHARSISGSVIFNVNMSFGGPGGTGGKGSTVSVDSVLDIYSQGNDAIGILVQSIGGGGGTGGSAYSNAATLEVPSDGDVPVPNITYVGAFGGGGGSGNTAGAAEVHNSGLVFTAGAGAIGILTQSIGGGGGAGGDATAISRVIPVQVAAAKESQTLAINVVTAVGGGGGDGGVAGMVTLHNGSTSTVGLGHAGVVLTQGDQSAGLVAQSIGGGGGKGGDAEAALYVDSFGDLLKEMAGFSAGKKSASVFSFDVAVAVGGGGGTGGNGNNVEVFNGEKYCVAGNLYGCTAYQWLGGTIRATGGASQGIVAQSIGGGGGNAGEGAVNGIGARVTIDVGVGGSGGAGGTGSQVNVINPAGAVISTGEVQIAQATDDQLAAGVTPYALVATGAGGVGILAQSIGGGGGNGGNADASSALDDSWLSKGSVAVGVLGYMQKIAEYAEEGKSPYEFEPSVSANISVGGKGGAGGNGGSVTVENGGAIETFGEQAHGIEAQSIGAGGGNGGAVEATSAYWESKASTFVSTIGGSTDVSIGMSVGGNGGGAGNGGAVTVTNDAGASILTHGYGANGILAQSVGGGGGYGGHATANAEGLVFIGSSKDGDVGATGKGSAVTVSSAGTITTWGDDANGILAQSIGGGGGTGVVGCTNSESGFSVSAGPFGGASPCWGNSESADGESVDNKDWGSYISINSHVGGATSYDQDTGDDGGAVKITVSGAITTHGSRSMGVVAQSIGGGGGFISGDATAFSSTSVAPNAGYNHSHGSAVTVDLDPGGSITTWGDGAWGVLAQSIGGGGGFVGDPSLSLGLLASNGVENLCSSLTSCHHARWVWAGNTYYDVGPTYTSGADGGAVTVKLASGTFITTHGRNAHGIVAESVGGGGGMAAGDGNSPNSLVYAGNPVTREWENKDQSALWWSGTGGAITIDVAQNASVDVQGEGSIGILAQSTGNNTYKNLIAITVEGTVKGGVGSNAAGDSNQIRHSTYFHALDPAAILVTGGQSGSSGPPNTITISSTGWVEGRGDSTSNQNAIVSMYGSTNLNNAGTIVGSIRLGYSSSDPNFDSAGFWGTFQNAGKWIAGPDNVLSPVYSANRNSGIVVIEKATKIDGALWNSGTMEYHNPGSNSALLTVTKTLTQDGADRLVFDNGLLNQWYWLVHAGTLSGGFGKNLTATNGGTSLTYQWNVSTSGGDYKVQPVMTATGASLGASLGRNGESVAGYLERAWDNNDPYFSKQFGYMLGIQTIEQYRDMLSAIDAPELLHNENTSLRALPTLLGEVIDCPRTGGADVIVSEGSCAWMQGGQSWGRYEGNDTPKGDVDGDLYSIGVQRELAEGWFVGGVFGRLNSDVRTDGFRGKGHTNVGGIGLKHESGRWLMGASLAYAKGSYDSLRRFELPVLGGAASAVDATLSSDSEMDVTALRLRASYAFGSGEWYLHPAMEVDLLRTDRSGFEEKASVGTHPFLLRADGETRTEYAFTPHVEVGMQRAVGEAMLLRTYVDAGVRLAPDADREIALQVAGANSADGWFRNTIDAPLATGLIKVGAQLFREDTLDLRLEYGLEANGDFRNQSATARLAWHF